MATKKLNSVLLSIRSEGGTVRGIAKGNFTVEDVASGSALVELEADTSMADAKAAIIAEMEEGGHTVLDETS